MHDPIEWVDPLGLAGKSVTTSGGGSSSISSGRVPTHNTRKIFNQLENEINPGVSCGSSCTAMVLDTVGKKGVTPADISRLIIDEYVSGKGTTALSLKKAMSKMGVRTKVFAGGSTNNTIARLQRLVSNETPAIVMLDRRHWVVLDEIVTMPDNTLLFKIRDPWKGVNYGLKQKVFEKKWNGGDIIATKK